MDSRQFLGACAAMFVVDLEDLQLNPQAAREAHIRLRRVLESKPAEPRLPVAVIMIDNEENTMSEGDIFSVLGIQQLRIDGLISECNLYTVSSLDHQGDLSRKLCSAVTWLGCHMVRSSLPRTDSLVNFIEDGLQREFTVPVSEDLLIRKQAKLEQQCPEVIIELYNSVLDHLGAVASSHSLQRLSWPVSEFADKEKGAHGLPDVTWNSHDNLQRLHSCITALKLSPPPPAAVDGTWESESELCLEYAGSLSPNTTSLLNSLESSRPRKTKDAKLHESFVDMEQQFDEIKGTSHIATTPSSLQTTSLVTPSHISMPSSVTPLLVTPPLVTPILVAPSMDIESPSPCPPDSAIRATSEQLQAAVEEAKTESKRFEELLKNVLGDGENPRGLGQSAWRKRKAQSLGESKKSPKFPEGLDLPDIDISFGSLEEGLSCFNETLKSQRRSDQFTERRLKECLES
ncbi:Germinal-center associated nuclear protein [Desmophyllum pertusum]|uniref:Germinal-center associated nuclear protein n=1 Tax=Desmophyllum pertusum TaxID=174260 RepID=A0A9X0CLA0_9CNID|nr:Germinal-center associated nuclear protein [Desmophyllum pertusum]